MQKTEKEEIKYHAISGFLTRSEWQIFRSLVATPQSLKELFDSELYSKGGITRALNSLRRRGLIYLEGETVRPVIPEEISKLQGWDGLVENREEFLGSIEGFRKARKSAPAGIEWICFQVLAWLIPGRK